MRGRLAAILIVVTLAACGDGATSVDAAADGPGAVDRPVVTPDDAPEAAPADAGPADAAPEDAGPACDPESGQLLGGPCRVAFDCRCPRACLALVPAPAAGACFTDCDPALTDAGGQNPACRAGEVCLADDAGAPGCVPRGTLTGTFEVPMLTPPQVPASAADLGAADLTLSVGLIGEMIFSAGFGQTLEVGGATVHRLTFYPGSGPTVDWDKPLYLELPADASYAPGATFALGAAARGEYHELVHAAATLTRDVLRVRARSGLITLASAGQGDRDPVGGAIADGLVDEVEAEVCGDLSAPCGP